MFLKYLSIGHHDLKHTAIMYNNLEIIRMDPVCFDDMKEIRVILCLITSSPNLKKLYISVSPYSLHSLVNFVSFYKLNMNSSVINFYITKYLMEFSSVHQT